MTDETTPAETAETGAISLTDALASRQTEPATVAPQEAAPEPAPQASAQPAPTAETPQTAPAGQPVIDFDAVSKDPRFDEWAKSKLPKFAREHIAQVNRERAIEKAEVEALRAQRPAQPQPAQQFQLPDPMEDPQGFAAGIRHLHQVEMQQFQLRQTLMVSERFARQQHGETFEDARSWLSTRPDIEQWALQQPDPWNAAITLYQRERLAEEIGDDPRGYEQRLREQITAEVEARMQQQPQPTPQPQMRTMPNPPPSASGARSAAPVQRDDQGRFTPIGQALKHNFR